MQQLFRRDQGPETDAAHMQTARLTEFMMQLNDRLDKRFDLQTARTTEELTGMRKQLSILDTTKDTLSGLNEK
eukprot:2548697-Prorocentrum_lima.AAC.1